MRRTLVAVALASSLFTATPDPSGLLEQIWAFLGSFWSAPADSKEGCGMDPDGLQSPEPQNQAPEGCGMDPWGRCIPDPHP